MGDLECTIQRHRNLWAQNKDKQNNKPTTDKLKICTARALPINPGVHMCRRRINNSCVLF